MKKNKFYFILIQTLFLFFSSIWAVDVPLFHPKKQIINIKKLVDEENECSPEEGECYIEDECGVAYEVCIEQCEEDDDKCLDQCDREYNACINSNNNKE